MGFLAFAHIGAGQRKHALGHFQKCLQCLEEKLGPCHLTTAIILGMMGNLHHDMGNHEQAVLSYDDAIQIRHQLFAEEDAELADLYNKLGMNFEAMDLYEKALPCYERVRTIWEATFGENHSHVAAGLYNVANMQHKLNQYDEALLTYHHSLTIGEAALGPNHPTLASTLNNLAILHKTLENFDEALSTYERSLSIWEQQRPIPVADIGLSLMNMGHLYVNKGEYDTAFSFYDRALPLFENSFGTDSLEVAQALSNIAIVEHEVGNFDDALNKHKRSLSIKERLLSPDHQEVGTSYINLANVYQKIGLFKEAISFCEEGLNILTKYWGPEHLDVCRSQMTLAMLYQQRNDFKKSLSLYKEALPILKHHLGDTHSDVAKGLYNLGNIYTEMGDIDRAIPYYQQAIEMNQTIFGEYHKEVGIPLHNLGNAYEGKGEYGRALEAYQQAYKAFKHALGQENLYVAGIFNHIGVLFAKQHQYENARRWFERSLQIREKFLDPHHPQIAESLGNLARVLLSNQQLEKAEQLSVHALAIMERSLGRDRLEVAKLETNLALIYLAMRKSTTALEHYKRSIEIENQYIRVVFNSVATEKQKLACVQSIENTMRGFLAVLSQYFKTDLPELQQGFEWMLQRKGIVFTSQINAHDGVRKKLRTANAKNEWEKRQELLGDLSLLLLHAPDELYKDLDRYQKRKSMLLENIEEIEERLISENTNLRSEIKAPTFDEIRTRLPAETALIEFVKIHDFAWMEFGTGSASSYLAFVVSTEGDLSLVDLGSGDELDNVIQDVRNAIQHELHECLQEEPNMTRLEHCTQKAKTALGELYHKVWEPIEGHLGCPTQIFISPDGELNTVPFSALINPQGEFLINNYSLAYVTTSQEFISKGTSIQCPEVDLFTISNPDFGRITNPEDLAALPWTQEEVERIQSTFPKGTRICGLTNVDATKAGFTDFLNEQGGARILHLATHGVFKNDKSLHSDEFQPWDSYENPLMGSGLVFAGANNSLSPNSKEQRKNSAILTALEVTGLNLDGCELVVLSACHTGFGKVRNGEGVFGLRRAFALAGAKNLMMSLWVASDEDTTQQMMTFYEHLHRTTPAESLRTAQLQSIKALEVEAGFAPVSLWAPFIIQGSTAFERWSLSTL